MTVKWQSGPDEIKMDKFSSFCGHMLAFVSLIVGSYDYWISFLCYIHHHWCFQATTSTTIHQEAWGEILAASQRTVVGDRIGLSRGTTRVVNVLSRCIKDITCLTTGTHCSGKNVLRIFMILVLPASTGDCLKNVWNLNRQEKVEWKVEQTE